MLFIASSSEIEPGIEAQKLKESVPIKTGRAPASK
jgi:hypothetical protein